jgi:hypothetical protein
MAPDCYGIVTTGSLLVESKDIFRAEEEAKAVLKRDLERCGKCARKRAAP